MLSPFVAIQDNKIKAGRPQEQLKIETPVNTFLTKGKLHEGSSLKSKIKYI